MAAASRRTIKTWADDIRRAIGSARQKGNVAGAMTLLETTYVLLDSRDLDIEEGKILCLVIFLLTLQTSSRFAVGLLSVKFNIKSGITKDFIQLAFTTFLTDAPHD